MLCRVLWPMEPQYRILAGPKMSREGRQPLKSSLHGSYHHSLLSGVAYLPFKSRENKQPALNWQSGPGSSYSAPARNAFPWVCRGWLDSPSHHKLQSVTLLGTQTVNILRPTRTCAVVPLQEKS